MSRGLGNLEKRILVWLGKKTDLVDSLGFNNYRNLIKELGEVTLDGRIAIPQSFRASVSRAIRRLAAIGLIEVKYHSKDPYEKSKIKNISLTAAGKEMVNNLKDVSLEPKEPPRSYYAHERAALNIGNTSTETQRKLMFVYHHARELLDIDEISVHRAYKIARKKWVHKLLK